MDTAVGNGLVPVSVAMKELRAVFDEHLGMGFVDVAYGIMYATSALGSRSSALKTLSDEMEEIVQEAEDAR